MADGRHFKNSFYQYLSRESSVFDEILYADANFDSEDGHLTKIEILEIRHGDRAHIENFSSILRRHF